MQTSVSENRQRFIGGSDIPIIMGISHFKSRYDLLLEKAELKENTFKGNEYTEYGNVMEDKIRQFINDKVKTNFVEDKKIIGDIRCHVDGFNGTEILEVKTTSQVHSDLAGYRVYLVQLLFYMENYGAENGILAVYERPDDFSEDFDASRLTTYHVKLSEHTELVEQINSAVNQFRADLAKLKANPFLSEQDLLPADLSLISAQVIEIENQLAAYDELIKQRDTLKDALKQAMTERGIKKWTTPNGTQITLVPDGEDKEVQKFNEKKFSKEQPDIYSEYMETRTQKGRKGYVRITLA